jgi:hypothetical protein
LATHETNRGFTISVTGTTLTRLECFDAASPQGDDRATDASVDLVVLIDRILADHCAVHRPTLPSES